MADGTVSIVMATDDNYVMHCYIAILSVRDNANDINDYNIYVLENGLDAHNRQLLESLSVNNFRVYCKNISSYINGIPLKRTRFLSVETYFRLFIPIVFPELKRVLYLDSDICVLSDVAELFNENLHGKAVGAVRDIPTNNIKVHSKDLGELDYRVTFNAGILLMDLSQFEEDHIRERCLELLEKDNERSERLFVWADQDALNIVLYNKIHYLEDVWNYQVQYLKRPQVILDGYKDIYIKNSNKAKILHFAGGDKLWFYPEFAVTEKYWGLVKRTPFLTEFFRMALDRVRGIDFERYQFPYDMVRCNSRIVLYGAGKIGQCFFSQLHFTDYATIVLWIDSGWQETESSYEIKPPEMLTETEYDYIVVAVEKESVMENIKDYLIGLGVNPDRIVWKRYLRKKQIT